MKLKKRWWKIENFSSLLSGYLLVCVKYAVYSRIFIFSQHNANFLLTLFHLHNYVMPKKKIFKGTNIKHISTLIIDLI